VGQKSNPNSFHLISKKAVTFGGAFNVTEYATLLKDYFSVSSRLIAFFEKNNCLVKDCFFILSNEKSFLTVFINFLVVKRVQKSRFLLNAKGDGVKIDLIVHKFFNVLSNFGYKSSKRLVLQNLNAIALRNQKTFFSREHLRIKKELNLFSKEIYFETGLFLFCLMQTTKKTSLLFSKFIARFFRIFHRTKKINKFLLFLSKFVENIDNTQFGKTRIKGLKVQIKGRFKGVPRSKIRVFERGCIPLQTISNNINYSLVHVNTSYGIFGVKVWVFE